MPSVELRLLLTCCRVAVDAAGERAIRGVLQDGIDWTAFARLALGHGLAGLAGHSLASVAPELVPEDILEALRTIVDQTGRANRGRFEELAGILEGLAANGIQAITFKGPALALRAYGDLALRVYRDLDILVRDHEFAGTIATLHRLGYVRQEHLTDAQNELILRLQGQDGVLNPATGTMVEPHTRLTGVKFALDIDYAGLRERARPVELKGRTLLLLAPEDDLIVLAIHGSKEMWWNMKWACDIAAFITAHPSLDWTVLLQRAREQGCLRMVLLATALARRYFDARVPEAVRNAERADPRIDFLIGRITSHWWRVDEKRGPPTSKRISPDRLLLHDGLRRRTRYLARTLFLPGPHHVEAIALPRSLAFAYVPLKLVHDLLALPAWRLGRQAVKQVERMKQALVATEIGLALLPASNGSRAAAIRLYGKTRAAAERDLAANPNDPAAWRRLGDAFASLKRHKEAIACYEKVLEMAPQNTAVWKQRAAALAAVGQDPATAQAMSPTAEDAEAWAINAGRLFSTNRFAEAIEASDHALALDPEHSGAARVGIHARLYACDWSRREQDKQRISEGVRHGKGLINSFYHRALSGSEAEHLELSRLSSRGLRPAAQPLWSGEPYRHRRVRVGYLSTDLRHHVVSEAIAGCLETHDRARFEVTALSLGPDDRSAMRTRIAAACERFIDARTLGDEQIARRIRELEIDVLIDLNGSSGENRREVLLYRAAPVQASYLGYPGTTAMPCVDYIIADRWVIPSEQRCYYTEQVLDLPHTFMPTDRTRPIAPRTLGRLEAGLPETGFVFACHNHEYKLGPEVFEVWMRLLRALEGSVLWLKSVNPAAVVNLRHEARARNVAPERLVFAPHVPRSEDHLARLRLADLFLDTLPYNAHATACDALWAGLPVLTCLGGSFPGRVGASLLHAVGLPELVTSSLTEYEALALALARDPVRLSALKATLARNRDTHPLFDTQGFTRQLEAAYTTMVERRAAGLPAASFSVAG